MLLLLLVRLFSTRLSHTGEEGLGLFLILQDLKQCLVYGNVTQCVCSVLSDSLRSHGLQPPQAPLSVGILQARILEWVAHFLLQGIVGIEPMFLVSPALTDSFFTIELAGKFIQQWGSNPHL